MVITYDTKRTSVSSAAVVCVYMCFLCFVVLGGFKREKSLHEMCSDSLGEFVSCPTGESLLLRPFYPTVLG